MFSLSFISRNFLISLLISSVTCSLFRNVFNLHVFVFLTPFLLEMMSSLIALWSEKILFNLILFKFLKIIEV